MLSKSQSELTNLANEAIAAEKFSIAKDYLIEANKISVLPQISCKLIEVELLLEEEDQAYLSLKELPDLFSNLETFSLYQRVLVANHLKIEQLQVAAQLEKLNSKKNSKQYAQIIFENQVQLQDKELIKNNYDNLLNEFARHAQFTQVTINLLHQLEVPLYLQLVRLYLSSPNSINQNRIILIEDLIKLNLSEEISVQILGDQQKFIPITKKLFFQTEIYCSGRRAAEKLFYKDPIYFQQIMSEFTYCLQAIYPVEQVYINDAVEFLNVLVQQMNGMLDKSESMGYLSRLIMKIYSQG